MPRVSPFRALTYDVDRAGPLDRLTAPPYDTISDPRRAGLLAGSPHNVVHLDLAEGSEDPAAAGNRYARASALLRSWALEGIIRVDAEARYHAYEMSFDLAGRQARTRGLFVALELEPWGGDILPHEDTMPGPVHDRLCLLRETRTHLSAVYGTVAGPVNPLRELLEDACAAPPDAEIVDEEGVRHRRWRLPADAAPEASLAGRHLLIADGHHRYTTALAFREERRAEAGPGPWDRILALVVDAGTEDVPVMPYHRVQTRGRPIAGGDVAPSLEELLAALDDDTLRYGVVSGGRHGPRFAWGELDGDPPTVRELHAQVLDASAPADALRFTHDVDDAVASVVDGTAVAAYLLPATTPQRILAVVERGERLPRKSTFFWPKPRTGMVMMPVDGPG